MTSKATWLWYYWEQIGTAAKISTSFKSTTKSSEVAFPPRRSMTSWRRVHDQDPAMVISFWEWSMVMEQTFSSEVTLTPLWQLFSRQWQSPTSGMLQQQYSCWTELEHWRVVCLELKSSSLVTTKGSVMVTMSLAATLRQTMPMLMIGRRLFQKSPMLSLACK